MRFDGKWHLCNDGYLRPVIGASAQGTDTLWYEFPMLVDTGADRTVLNYAVLSTLGLEATASLGIELEGLGGTVPSVEVVTSIYLTRETGARVPFHHTFSAVADPMFSSMSILGRDILNMLAVIIDRPSDVVCLAAGNHRYVVTGGG